MTAWAWRTVLEVVEKIYPTPAIMITRIATATSSSTSVMPGRVRFFGRLCMINSIPAGRPGDRPKTRNPKRRPAGRKFEIQSSKSETNPK